MSQFQNGRIALAIPLGGSYLSWIPTPFFMSCLVMQQPEGFGRALIHGGGTYQHDARNSLVKAALEQKDVQAIMFCDADMVFPMNAMVDLAKNIFQDGYRVAVGLYCDKYDESLIHLFKNGDNGDRVRLTPEEAATMDEVEAAGTGCMMIHREVFEKVPFPWFTIGNPTESSDVGVSEDVIFCEKVRAAGYRIKANRNVVCGHILSGPVYPTIPGVEVKGMMRIESKGKLDLSKTI
jgi:hypothetical protein